MRGHVPAEMNKRNHRSISTSPAATLVKPLISLSAAVATNGWYFIAFQMASAGI